MRRLLPALAVLFLGACSPPPKKPDPLLSMQTAKEAVTVGRSTKADVRAALGGATVVDFESGYEVWVYSEKPHELVLLFDPSGVLSKRRAR